ncbi:MAG: hypothetical protein IPO66_04550 [Rhodanobacteraceae bacterium]|nr:hypothetical protein [Rhodanobacteraceae bacterium]
METTPRMSAPTRIAMVEDKPLLRLGVQRVVDEVGDWIWAWEAESLHTARAQLQAIPAKCCCSIWVCRTATAWT